jgi:DNA-binding IclR family transcriptional regulator
MSTNNAGDRMVKTTKTVFAIIEKIEDLDRPTVSELADALDLAVSTVHDHLKTLEATGYVVEEDKRYQLGLQFLKLGMASKAYIPVASIIAPYLERIAEETSETAWFLVEENGLSVHLDSAIGEHGLRTANRIGRRSHLHYHAGGKAIMANLPENRIAEIIDRHGLPEKTEHTITDVDALYEDLADIRDRGYALNDNEDIIGARSVSAPLLVDDNVLGAISVGGPANHLKGDLFMEELPDYITGIANEIRLEMQYS